MLFWIAVYRKAAIDCREITTVCVLRNAKWSTSAGRIGLVR
jgi:hypothetical protein